MDKIREGVFLKLFQECEIAQYKPQEIMEYEQSWKEKNDWQAALSTSESKGMEKKALEIARNAILEGASNEFIAKITGLSIKQIEALRKEK